VWGYFRIAVGDFSFEFQGVFSCTGESPLVGCAVFCEEDHVAFRILCSAVLASLTLAAGHAGATVIDFTGSAFSGATGRETFSASIDGIGVTVLEARPVGAELYQTSEGLGVDSPWGIEDPGEIGLPEQIVVSFDDPQFIEEIYVAQLFRESGWLGTVNESGWYSLDGGAKTYFEASGAASGLLTIAVGSSAETISFGAKLAGLSHDYSLSGLNVRTLGAGVAAIPEPISIYLLGIGGIVIGAAVRRKI
jgi:hypothetical protein